MSPRQVLASHTSRELTEWQAFYRAEALEAELRSGKPLQAGEEQGETELQEIFDQRESIKARPEWQPSPL